MKNPDLYHTWFASDACHIANVSLSDARNWRFRSRKCGSATSDLFNLHVKNSWQVFDLKDVCKLAVIKELLTCGISLKLALEASGPAGEVVSLWARDSAQEGWDKFQRARWLVAMLPAKSASDFTCILSDTSVDFFEWSISKPGRSECSAFAAIDLKTIGRRIASRAGEL